MDNITNLHELVELGLKLQRYGVPKNLMVSVQVDVDAGSKIYGQLLDDFCGDVDEYKATCARAKRDGQIKYFTFKLLGIRYQVYYA